MLSLSDETASRSRTTLAASVASVRSLPLTRLSFPALVQFVYETSTARSAQPPPSSELGGFRSAHESFAPVDETARAPAARRRPLTRALPRANRGRTSGGATRTVPALTITCQGWRSCAPHRSSIAWSTRRGATSSSPARSKRTRPMDYRCGIRVAMAPSSGRPGRRSISTVLRRRQPADHDPEHPGTDGLRRRDRP